MDWIKSSYSFANGNCVEVAATPWRKSSHSNHNGACAEAAGNWRKSSASIANGDCAEVGSDAGRVLVRDTKLGAGSPVLAFPTGAWTRFTAQVKRST